MKCKRNSKVAQNIEFANRQESAPVRPSLLGGGSQTNWQMEPTANIGHRTTRDKTRTSESIHRRGVFHAVPTATVSVVSASAEEWLR